MPSEGFFHQEEVSRMVEVVHQEEVHQEEVHQEEVHQEEVHQEEVHQEEAHQEGHLVVEEFPHLEMDGIQKEISM